MLHRKPSHAIVHVLWEPQNSVEIISTIFHGLDTQICQVVFLSLYKLYLSNCMQKTKGYEYPKQSNCKMLSLLSLKNTRENVVCTWHLMCRFLLCWVQIWKWPLTLMWNFLQPVNCLFSLCWSLFPRFQVPGGWWEDRGRLLLWGTAERSSSPDTWWGSLPYGFEGETRWMRKFQRRRWIIIVSTFKYGRLLDVVMPWNIKVPLLYCGSLWTLVTVHLQIANI